MIVTFVSQCQKNALHKTRQILDAFANRIGDTTWQTVITQEGLDAVQRMLRKSASKNTSVSCHRIHGTSRTELLWIVGNRKKFNHQGHVPVNTSYKDTRHMIQEDHWPYLALIQALTALAALFHDWGKATACFQEKLQNSVSGKCSSNWGDPLRHEWISCLLLQAFVNQSGKEDRVSDQDWLKRLIQSDLSQSTLVNHLKSIDKPLAKLPPAASLVAWLVLTHHKLPLPQSESELKYIQSQSHPDFASLFELINSKYGYQNSQGKEEQKIYQQRLEKCFQFAHGDLNQSEPWLKDIKRWAKKLDSELANLNHTLENGCWRLILHHCRLSLMLGDHHYSSQAFDQQWTSDLPDLFANTAWDKSETSQKNRISKKYKSFKKVFNQKLDEHLVNVSASALKINYLLPAFEDKLPVLHDIRRLKKQSPEAYKWQDRAVKAIKTWRSHITERQSIKRTGFFAINMASTGCGKTLANAKIMRALSEDYDSLRYILALGLRTLTLQTGDEYRKHLGVDDTALAVLIGSKAMSDLHHLSKQSEKEELDSEFFGSESAESLLENNLDYQGSIPEDLLKTVLTTEKDRQFLYAPLLVCTIDHLMSATETKRGGRYILPCLRLMSSDLVIDEVDDFDGSDLIAIGRLIHLAGMLGRKVMISSATIPPDLAEGYFNAYREGWLIYSRFCQDPKSLYSPVKASVSCAWVDEFQTEIQPFSKSESIQSLAEYRQHHANFIQKRAKQLSDPSKTKIRRKGLIIDCEDIKEHKDSKESKVLGYFERIRETILDLHCQHSVEDPVSKKSVSFGVVRMANVNPCVALAKYLLEAEWESNLAPKVMAYHSRQVMLLRSEQEKHLDQVLKRKDKHAPFENQIIRHHLEQTDADNVVFILVATPVEEIGRDHDFDWAVIEPSSFRSIIQLAGRVLRHRPPGNTLTCANIALMQYNLKALQGKSIAYHYPGYEKAQISNDIDNFSLSTHDLKELLSDCQIENSINAIPRIQKNSLLNPQQSLIDLEHFTMQKLLTNYESFGADGLQGWLTQAWFLSALPQYLHPFRKGQNNLLLYRMLHKEQFEFMERTEQGRFQVVTNLYNIRSENIKSEYVSRLWLERNYEYLLEQTSEALEISISQSTERYGEINLLIYYGELHTKTHYYSDQFGAYQNL